MSTLYNLEPQPTAKVLLNTTSGDLVLELFAKQTPLTSRNFLQHCLDGYYDHTIFHRLVPGFIIQGGDPTGTGSGGVSAVNDGAPFADEFHSRLKFNRRGLLGMANSGDKNDNTSQFFLTLGNTPELQGKNTMFGRIEGDTIYNLMKMGEADLASEDSDRPLYPTRVVSTEILLNPFSDMVKRMSAAAPTATETSKAPKKKRKAQKTLLSFGGEDGDEPAAPVVKKAKVNPNFTSAGQQPAESLTNAPVPKAPEQSKSKPIRRRSPTRSPSPPPTVGAGKETPVPLVQDAAPSPSPSPSPSPEPEPKKLSRLEQTNAEIAALKASMKRGTTTTAKAPEKKVSALEAMIPTSSSRGRKRGKPGDERGALDMFNAFKKRLEKLPAEEETVSKGPAITTNDSTAQDDATPAAGSSALDAEANLCDLHFIANCQSCSNWHDEAADKEAEDDNDVNWMSHALSFAKDTLGKDLEWKRKMEEFEVIDPREKTKEIVGEKRAKGKDRSDRKEGGRDWDRARDKEKSRR